MTRLIYGLPSLVAGPSTHEYPGMLRYSHFLKLYGNWTIPVDRTGTVTMPVRDLSLFPIPKFRPFSKTFEELCNERALQVLSDAEKLAATMYVLYSGGIDSTCLLVSLLKNATRDQKENIVVLLSHESIAENPHFYDEHIRGKLRVGSSIFFPELIGEDCYLLSAEHNDMVIGSEKIGKMIMLFGPESIRESYNRDTIAELFSEILAGDETVAYFYVDLFERIASAAPIPLETNMDFLWWANFVIKWQSCFHYILLFTPLRNAHKVTQEYLDKRFISFYNTDEFQLWSMNNLDKRIKDTWKSYKWVLKDIIYDYTKDAEYRDHKTKKGSLLPLIGYNPPNRFIDENMRFRNDLMPEDYLQPKNDFV